ncbi:serine-rich adhesin for platelets-like [Musca domestica]|uniref:Serine-rich adhesin for platelets-like n=1 Tax=Musca domestica TaxID=7370 RepID=A0ABM3V0U3_MUSDO|nr:serine-rich adhesin for platelets-like [Musca domestica]XP_058979406.1 serine-rich adhesin for platelets-like [Musca domestica]XP_058979407.1 serine-rich adhesin for platelets-like [Musca domestica]
MGENVQCPVCTLYLHAGMNLSDHLETHPKEQVIRALVQMTISGGSGGGTAALASVLKGTCSNSAENNKSPSEQEEKSISSNDKIIESNIASTSNSCNASISSSASNCSLSNQSNTTSQNSNNVLNFSNTSIADNSRSESQTPCKSALKLEEAPVASKDQSIKEATSEVYVHSHRPYTSSSNDVPANTDPNFGIFGNPRFQNQHRTVGSQQHQQMPPPPAPQGQHGEIPRTILPPPPPMPQSMSSQSIQTVFQSIQAQQLSNSQQQHHSSHARQPHIYTSQHHQHPPQHQQDMKVIYASGLPPPPPLQLFSSYQQPSQLQHHHQKPPPAYGTAISQIRSQNKHQLNGQFAGQHHHTSITSNADAILHQQHHLHQQQATHPHHIRMHGNVAHQLHPIATKHLFSKTNDIPQTTSSTLSSQTTSRQSSNVHQQHQHGKYILPSLQQQPISVENSALYNNCPTANDSQEKTIKASTANGSGSAAHISHSAQPNVGINPAVASASMAVVTASTLNRPTNSPFAALLAAASPSAASSVLRYAESPVAHYLERDNGDFIVQETPKHIVECVEKDNGEFSVIERIYQSPPSVLHIHDDADDDEEDDDKTGSSANGNNTPTCTNEVIVKDSKEEAKDANIKHPKKKISSQSTKNDNNSQTANTNKMSIDSKAQSRKLKQFESSTSSDNEVEDFVSISSDSDEEEFISHERNGQTNKNTTEKIKKNQSDQTLPPTPSTSASAPRLQHPSPTNLETHSATAVSTSNASNSTSTVHQNSNTTRKKSSKNTITVLSDVQLNLNEYLDLVGNIIASSKVAAQRRTLTAIAPIPLVKIEKEEPMDDYATTPADTAEQHTLPPTPLKANKQETEELTDNPSCSSTNNKSSKISLTDQTVLEKDEKKPQILENNSDSSKIISSLIPNSSQVTSVIRMATTSLQQSQQQQQQNAQQSIVRSNENTSDSNESKTEAEDLSQHQRNLPITGQNKTTSLGLPTLGRKGPKKLVIKPKSSKTSSNDFHFDDQQPSTSAKALEEYNKLSLRTQEKSVNEPEVQVKNEPLTSIAFESNQYTQPTGYSSILEQQLTSKEPIMLCKEEKPCIQETNVPTDVKDMKVENNVNEDARVLYDFATSKKGQASSKPSTFPSPSSLFSKNQTVNQKDKENVSESKVCNLHSTNEAQLVHSSHLEATSKNGEVQNKASTASSSDNNDCSEIFPDFPFNYLNNNNNSHISTNDQTVDVKNSTRQMGTLYCNSATSNNTGSSSMILDDSMSSKNYSDYNQNQQQPMETNLENQWFNNYQATTEAGVVPSSNQSNSNVHLHMSAAECNSATDANEVGKYLDLDECKRERNVESVAEPTDGCGKTVEPPPPPPSSSTSCSFTENSMAGICSTAGTLNIRTDEKMPAKGEISEQESNCDIDNSWSQPIYGDISARFFKTTFPGIFQQDNGWNHEEYFAVQDLSASTTSQTDRTKSFDFRLPPDDGTVVADNSASSGLTMFSQNSNDNCNIDVMPSTSAKVRKRRKRSSQDGKASASGIRRVQPTSTITSQQLMEGQGEMQAIDYNFQQEHLPSTSSALLAGPPNAEAIEITPSSSSGSQQQRIRTKIYECSHCNAKYSKLKDRNAHLVDSHNYVRQNRRLVCLTNGMAVSMSDHAATATTSRGANVLLASSDLNADGDFKQGIVKIENENAHRDVSGFEHISADLNAKTEFVEDDKNNLSLVPLTASSSASDQLGVDTKQASNFKPLSVTTASNKLTTLYRMLVTYNMTTLKQSQRLSEFDETLIKSSIFFCYVCRENFNSVKLYDAHLTEHPAECFTCGKKFQRWKNFSLHLKRHLGWKEFGCTVCDKKFVVRSALVEHMRMHSGLSPLKCKICGKHFKRYSNLTQHRKRHTKQVVRRKEYVCYCGEVLPSKARFLWHKETHDSKPKCCPHCCDRFVHVNSLRRHIRLAHSDKFDYTEPMECPICKQIFAKASMKAHMATHSTETQYDCAICNKSFSTKWNLKIHSWVHANRTAKPFKCEHCPKAFVREVDFKNHMNSHKQIKPYTCEVCGCKFIRKYNYMRHRREHHGNKKYTCDLCKKSFHRHYYLIEHRRIHTGERPFQCTICGKSSTTKTNHNKHLKIHHSRDPFTVEV